MSIVQQHTIYLNDNHFISEYQPENSTLGTGAYSSKYSQYFLDTHCVDDAGFFYCTATTGRFGGQYYPPSVLVRSISKLTQTGQVIFTKDFNSIYPSINRMYFLDNHIYAIGYHTATSDSSGNNVGADAMIIKLTTDLDIVWFRLFGNNDTTTDYENFDGLAIDSSNNVYVVGEGTTYTGSTPGASAILKYNSSGTLQWKKDLKYQTGNNNTSEAVYANNIHVDSNNGVYVTGSVIGGGGGNKYSGTPSCNNSRWRSLQIKLDSSSSVTWRKSRRAQQTVNTGGPSDYTGCYSQYGASNGTSGLDSNGNLYHAFSNWQLSYSVGDQNFRGYGDSFIKRNSSGVLQWEKCWFVNHNTEGYNGSSITGIPQQLQFDADDNIYLCSRSGIVSGQMDRPIILMKFNSSGVNQWVRRITRTNLDSSNRAPFPKAFKINKEKKYFTISGYMDISNPNPDNVYRGFLLKLPLDGKTGTYGDWTYAAETDFTFNTKYPDNSGHDITGVDTTTNITTYSTSYIDNRHTLSANNITLSTGAIPGKNHVEYVP